MHPIRFVAIATEVADAFRAGRHDANGQPPEQHVSDGAGIPCRHCLQTVRKNDRYLILAYRPFSTVQPYAEVGPIFLHADPCVRHEPSAEIPASFFSAKDFLVRGYDARDRIIYGTGQIVSTGSLADVASRLLDQPQVAYLHVRSAKNNCYRCRIERAT